MHFKIWMTGKIIQKPKNDENFFLRFERQHWVSPGSFFRIFLDWRTYSIICRKLIGIHKNLMEYQHSFWREHDKLSWLRLLNIIFRFHFNFQQRWRNSRIKEWHTCVKYPDAYVIMPLICPCWCMHKPYRNQYIYIHSAYFTHASLDYYLCNIISTKENGQSMFRFECQISFSRVIVKLHFFRKCYWYTYFSKKYF